MHGGKVTTFCALKVKVKVLVFWRFVKHCKMLANAYGQKCLT